MNFAILLFFLTLLSGTLWIFDQLFAAPRRRKAEGSVTPFWVEWGSSFFPVLLSVFLLRSFFVEPFRIPSSSMLPTLESGDFILVSKFAYGLRLPIWNIPITEITSPQYGDVIVFRYPNNEEINYIKRVIGCPGDKISYRYRTVYINEKPLDQNFESSFFDEKSMAYFHQYEENASEEKKYHIYLNTDRSPHFDGRYIFPFRENCIYSENEIECQIPPGHYFVMGDNRDNSYDSRAWGFVPEGNILGKAFFVWFHIEDFLYPFGLDFSRIGRIS